MRIYTGTNKETYIETHMTMQEIKTLVCDRLKQESIRIGKEMREKGSDN